MPQNTSLSLGNHIYLYRLLSEALGCGKQTFLTQVEEALENESLGAEDLGFESTRELLEELDDFIKLTVFKGGRIYATVIAQPAWDEALAAPQKKADTGGKSWKKKRGDKSIKAVNPRRVKRKVVEAAEAAPVAAELPEQDAVAPSEPIAIDEQTTNDAVEQPSPADIAPEAPTAEDRAQSESADAIDADVDADASIAEACENAANDASQDEASLPAISLTVIYDPDNANAGITTIASGASVSEAPTDEVTPEEEDVEAETIAPVETAAVEVAADAVLAPEPAAAPAPEPESKPEPATAPTPVETSKPVAATEPVAVAAPEFTDPAAQYDDYPVDFSTEVFCPGDILAQLATLLPYGADAMGIIGEYYWIARERSTIEATRNRASFALRYTQASERHEAIVHLRRRPNTPGAMWTIDHIDQPEQ